jgi:hypothetical protein
MAYLSRIKNILVPSLLFLCVVFYQYGFSYHISMGSLGLLLLLLCGYKYITIASITLSTLVPALILFAFAIHILNYGEYENFARILRFCFTASILYLLIGSKATIKPPPEKVIVIVLIFLVTLVLYQYFINPYIKAPNSLMALQSEYLEVSDKIDITYYEFDQALRPSGPYTEPSVLALVACCIYNIILPMQLKFKKLLILLIVIIIFLSSSLLGYIGFFGTFFLQYRKSLVKNKKLLLISPLLIAIAYFSFSALILGRNHESGDVLDSSMLVRTVSPFIIIIENFMNFDLLGYPGDLYSHFLSLNIYSTMGEFPGHNGLLGLIQTFGLAGIFFIFLLFKTLKCPVEYFIVFLIGSQSGNFFSYEKVFLMIYVPMVYRNITQTILNKYNE